MSFLSTLGGVVVSHAGASPAKSYHETATLTEFMSTPTSPAPDAQALVETDEISATVARCINVISDDASQVPLQLLDFSKTKPEPVEMHPAIEIFRHINPVQHPVHWFGELFADVLTEGNHFSHVDRDNDKERTPIGFLRIPPHKTFVISHETRIIGGYLWKDDTGKPKRYDAQDVVHFRTRNPNSIYRGLGYLTRLRSQLLQDRYMRAWNLSRFKHGIPQSLIVNVKRQFATDEEFEKYASEQYEALRGVHNAGKPIFLRDGVSEIIPLDRPNEQELGFLASMKYTRNEIAMLFGIPPSRLSDFGESFRANASEQSKFYVLDTLMTWHRMFIDFLNYSFLPKFFPLEKELKRAGSRDLRYAFDYSQVRALAGSEKEIADTWAVRINSMQATPDEARTAQGRTAHGSKESGELFHNGTQITGLKQPEPVPDDGNANTEPGEATEDLEGAKRVGAIVRAAA